VLNGRNGPPPGCLDGHHYASANGGNRVVKFNHRPRPWFPALLGDAKLGRQWIRGHARFQDVGRLLLAESTRLTLVFQPRPLVLEAAALLHPGAQAWLTAAFANAISRSGYFWEGETASRGLPPAPDIVGRGALLGPHRMFQAPRCAARD